MTAVLVSIRPVYCQKIAVGLKTLEIRKSVPKCCGTFKVYIYCTLGGSVLAYDDYCGHDITVFAEDFIANGKVIGEFMCRSFTSINNCLPKMRKSIEKEAGLSEEELKNYIGGKNGFAWGISDLVIYDKPRELRDFIHKCDTKHPYPTRVTRPPQSWIYVEEP